MKNNTDEIGHEGKTQKKKFFLSPKVENELNLAHEDAQLFLFSYKKSSSSDKKDNNTNDLPSAFTFAAKSSGNMSNQTQIYNNNFDSTLNSSSISNFNNNNSNNYVDKLMEFVLEYNKFYNIITGNLFIVENICYDFGERLLNQAVVLEELYLKNNFAYDMSKEIDEANKVFSSIRRALDGFTDVNNQFTYLVHEMDLDVSLVGNNNVQEHNEDQC